VNLTISRKAHFNAAHKLYRPDWSDEKNESVFGKCANENFHGHNYDLTVSLTGKVDPETGYVYDLGKLKDIIKQEVEDYLDHKNLNLDIPEFKNLNPTAENIAILIYDRLINHFKPDYKLKITLFETPRNFVEYSG
jgi:6-pyruvoyltetrahydropterin/6-carboxytetrahydropterin synthase|tara:strand:- start:20 stop:427 length:408 start_codon:yes stop_codon:yes gene_type:complete